MKVNDIVKYVGEESDEIPFKQGDLVLLKREEAEGYAAVPFDKPKSKEATLVYPNEVEEIDEDELEAARDEAEKNADEDAAEAEAQKKKQAAAEKNADEDAAEAEAQKKKQAAAEKNADEDAAEAEAQKKTAAKKKTTPAKNASTRKTQKSSTAKKKQPAKKTAAKKTAATSKKNDADSGEEEVKLTMTKEVKAALRGKGAVRAARDLIAQGTISDFTLGGVLAKIAADRDFEKEKDPETGENFEGRKGFESFIERDLGIRYRKAQWLIEFYTTFSKAGVDPKKLAKAKYSKIKEVLAIVREKPEEAEEWIDKANSSKFEELKEEARRYERKIDIVKMARGKNDPTMVSYKFKVFNKQAKNVDEAIEKAKEVIEFNDDDSEEQQNAKAIYHIFSEWLQLQG